MSTATVTKIKKQNIDRIEEARDMLAAELYKQYGACRKVARVMCQCEQKIAERIDRLGISRNKGKYLKMPVEKKDLLLERIEDGEDTQAIMQALGLSKTTVNFYKRGNAGTRFS